MNRYEELDRAISNVVLCQEKLRILSNRGKGKRDEEVKYWTERLRVWTAYREEVDTLVCRGCATPDIMIGKTVMGSGAIHVQAICPNCGHNIKGPGQWISKRSLPPEILENLSTLTDYSLDLPPCEVCGERGVELHHWAPKELFPETFERWPKSYLCKRHHDEWHNAVTNPYRYLRNKQEKQDGIPNA